MRKVIHLFDSLIFVMLPIKATLPTGVNPTSHGVKEDPQSHGGGAIITMG